MQDQVRRDRAMVGVVWKRSLAICACIMLVFSTQKYVLNGFEHFDTLYFALDSHKKSLRTHFVSRSHSSADRNCYVQHFCKSISFHNQCKNGAHTCVFDL
jgi:hypothetical protein